MPFTILYTSLRKILSSRNLPFHLLAITSTYVCVVSGFDWQWFLATRNTTLQLLLFPALPAGMLIPIFSPIILLVIGLVSKKEKVSTTAWALGVSGALGWAVSSLYKFFTGRSEPPLRMAQLVDNSRDFHFGLGEHGIFWGWPSTHTTVAFATAVALIFLFPKNNMLRVLAPLYALYIGFSVSTNIHWFSDFAAGAIIGTLIGVVVGKEFFSVVKNSSSL